MARLLCATAMVILVSGCPGPSGNDGGTGGGRGGGTGGGGGLDPFGVTFLDPDARDISFVAMAVDRTQDRVGVAYFTPNGTATMMGHPDFALKYVEWKQGAVVVPPEKIRIVQQMIGLSIAFHPSTGEPYVAFMGGPDGFVLGSSILWFQSDAVYAHRSNGAWTETTVATTGDQVTCGNAVSDRGFLVGLWPSIAFDSTGKMYFSYRDGHDGQFPQQDWNGSDLEVWEGMAPPTTGVCVAQGGNGKKAYGGHSKIVIGANDQPAVIHDKMISDSDVNGKDVVFQQRSANGTWTPEGASLLLVANTQSGPSLAYDSVEGYGIAAVDIATNQLSYIWSETGAQWSPVDQVFGSGSGGWYPSLAMDPINHEPAIAYYVCSLRAGVNDTACTTTQDELRVAQRIGGRNQPWREAVVDTGGGYLPQLDFLGSGKRVLVYRVPSAIDPATGAAVTNAGALKIAVER